MSRHFLVGHERVGEIRVYILCGKRCHHGSSALPDELPILDVLAIEHDLVPLDGTCSSKEGSIPSEAGSHWLKTREISHTDPNFPARALRLLNYGPD